MSTFDKMTVSDKADLAIKKVKNGYKSSMDDKMFKSLWALTLNELISSRDSSAMQAIAKINKMDKEEKKAFVDIITNKC